MMNDPTNKATKANTSSRVLKKPSDFLIWLLESAAMACPVSVSV